MADQGCHPEDPGFTHRVSDGLQRGCAAVLCRNTAGISTRIGCIPPTTARLQPKRRRCHTAPPPPARPRCSKAGAGLKPFVPQLQTTFVKCLADPQKEARPTGGRAGHVVAVWARCFPPPAFVCSPLRGHVTEHPPGLRCLARARSHVLVLSLLRGASLGRHPQVSWRGVGLTPTLCPRLPRRCANWRLQTWASSHA